MIPDGEKRAPVKPDWTLPPALIGAFLLLLLMVASSLLLSGRLASDSEKTLQAQAYGRAINDVINDLRDAETGQRGFLLTREARYLRPFTESQGLVEPALDRVRLTEGHVGRSVYKDLAPPVKAKLAELRDTVRMAQAGQVTAAIARVTDGDGLKNMASAREVLNRERQFVRNYTVEIVDGSVRLARLLTYGLLGGVLVTIGLSIAWFRQSRRQLHSLEIARADAETSLAAFKIESDAREDAEGRLRQLQKMESLGQLTGGIAHDFNNMLAVVLGGIELAKKRLRTDPDRADGLLENAREGAMRAATLTSRLLAFSRNQPLAPAPLDVNKLVGGMCDMLDRTLGDNVSVECVYSAGLWRCYADPNEVENVILNLAVNARDAMPTGGKLTVETANAHIDDNYARSRPEVVAGQYVLICVTDTGSGMSQEVIERAFDPFYTTKAVGKGTGLGLSQVFGFAKQSGGHVAIYSEIGQGTTVKVYLPRYTGGEAALPSSVSTTDVPEGKSSEIILVVEDEQRVRHFAVDALRDLGYTAISAASPIEALHALAEQPEITLLFTDIVMPDMTGRQLADEALKLRPKLPILFTTGYTRNAVVHNGMIDIGVAFLPKPYTIADLARKVRDVLDGGGVNRTI